MEEGLKATQQHRVYGVGPDVLEGEPCMHALQRPRALVLAACCTRVRSQNQACGLSHNTHNTNTHPELARVESTGAWVIDGRVCNVLAVSRAFG